VRGQQVWILFYCGHAQESGVVTSQVDDEQLLPRCANIAVDSAKGRRGRRPRTSGPPYNVLLKDLLNE